MFLSLNMDDNPGLIGPILEEQKLTLAVLPANSYASDTLKVEFVPQNWIVDSNGIIRLKGVGSYPSPEKWEQGMKDAIERVRAIPIRR